MSYVIYTYCFVYTQKDARNPVFQLGVYKYMYHLEVCVYPTENYGFALQNWQIL